MLVDGDVARPGLTPAIGLEGRPGLNDVLEDTTRDISSVTYQTDVEGLFFVPAGAYNRHAPEFFAGSRMPQLIEALSRRVGRGVVIFDSPPLLAVTDALILAKSVDGVILVIDPKKTKRGAIQQAVEQLQRLDARLLGIVLNNIKVKRSSYYYNREYYYSKHYGKTGTDSTPAQVEVDDVNMKQGG